MWELVEDIGKAIQCERPIVGMPPWLGYLVSRIIGLLVHDVFITREEIRGLMSGLLDVDGPAGGSIRLSAWCRSHGAQLGRFYASELARRHDRTIPYTDATRINWHSRGAVQLLPRRDWHQGEPQAAAAMASTSRPCPTATPAPPKP